GMSMEKAPSFPVLPSPTTVRRAESRTHGAGSCTQSGAWQCSVRQADTTTRSFAHASNPRRPGRWQTPQTLILAAGVGGGVGVGVNREVTVGVEVGVWVGVCVGVGTTTNTAPSRPGGWISAPAASTRSAETYTSVVFPSGAAGSISNLQVAAVPFGNGRES